MSDIRIPRELLTSPLWARKPMSHGQALVHLIAQADEQGMVRTSQSELMEEFGWSRSQVRVFIDSTRFIAKQTAKPIAKAETTLKLMIPGLFGFLKKQNNQANRQASRQVNSQAETQIVESQNLTINLTDEKRRRPFPFDDASKVLMTDKEWNSFIATLDAFYPGLGIECAVYWCERAEAYPKWKQYKDHKATLLNWHRKSAADGRVFAIDPNNALNQGYFPSWQVEKWRVA